MCVEAASAILQNQGYEGLLCSDCKAGYRVSKRQCVKCADHLGDQAKHLGIGLLVLILALMALLSLGFIYAHRCKLCTVPSS